jgi:hypothetical protein
MDKNRWLIAIGGAVLGLMLLCAAFSLGVHVGRHGWGEQNLNLQLQGDRPPPGGGFDADPPDVIGQIRALSQEGMQLATRQGPRWIQVSPATVVENAAGDTLALHDLRLGNLVAVYGEHRKVGQILTSNRIIVIPTPRRTPP